MNILVIPDCQIKPDSDTRHLDWIGQYIVDKRPDIVVNLGDFADMASLCTYDRGTRGFEGRRYSEDTLAANLAMDKLMAPLYLLQEHQTLSKKKKYKPRLVFTLGNHEQRIIRAVEKEPILEGTIGLEDLNYSDHGWEVYPFLHPVIIEEVCFAHYLCSGAMGRPIGSAAAILAKKHMSAVVGHQQGRDIATASRADGNILTAIIAGSCYLDNMDYLNPQTNNHWRGIVLLHDVNKGQFTEVFVGLDYLQKRYER